MLVKLTKGIFRKLLKRFVKWLHNSSSQISHLKWFFHDARKKGKISFSLIIEKRISNIFFSIIKMGKNITNDPSRFLAFSIGSHSKIYIEVLMGPTLRFFAPVFLLGHKSSSSSIYRKQIK